MKIEGWRIKDCWICGKKFIVKYDLKTRKILTNCYHAYIHKHFFMGWSYQFEEIDEFNEHTKFKRVYKNNWWKILGYTWLQRKIVYGLWWLFKGWQRFNYWECENCGKKD